MRNFSFLTLLAALLIVGCTEVTIEQSNPLTEINSRPDLTASFADEGKTRTFVEDSKYLRWHEADLITAFFGNTLNCQYKFKGKTGDNSGTFSLVPSGELGTGNDLSSIYALYPYDENTTISDNGVISLNLPATQTYAENSFGKGANTMVAVTESVEDTFLSFKNACGYLKLKLYGDNVTIASIEVKGNNEEKIAGSATATTEFGGVPTIAMNDEATKSVTLDCGEGVSIGATADMATEFWIVLPETTFEGGITITATNTDGAVFSQSTTNTVAITRNDIQPMAALKAEFATAKPANNEIWYTNGSTTEPTAPTVSTAFGSANIVSNTYDNKKECWVIKFDGEVTTIGEPAFIDCTTLKRVIIPNSVTSIGNGAFCRCSNLTTVIIPESVSSIGMSSFGECKSLIDINIPNSITTIGDGAFNSCSNLVDIVIPASITAVGSDLFAGCTSLSNVTLPNNLISIGVRAFSNCTSLRNITIPDSVKTIGKEAFRSCSQLSTISIPSSVTVIGDSVFAECTSLTDATISDSVSSIGSYAFGGCCSLINVSLPNSLSSIAYQTFHSCSSLANITIPDSVTTIESAAFYNCIALSSITIPENVSSIGESAFSGCILIENVVIPDKVVSIESNTFEGCTSLADVTIPNSVTTIGSQAFINCTSLTAIVIPENISAIDQWVFSGCILLKDVYCKATTPPTLGPNGVFLDCASDLKIYVPAESVELYKGADWWSNFADIIVGYNFETGEVVPETPVRPANNEIWYTSSDGSVVTPYNTDAFGANVLSNVYENGMGVITFDGEVTTVGMDAFFNCASLSSITISDSVTSIGDCAFAYCSLTSVTIPDSVTEIGTNPFIGCTNLKKFEGKFAADNGRCLIKDNVIISYANTSGTEYTIPDSVTTIGNYAFHSCISLTSVIIPDSVTSIGNRAFLNCYSLTSVTIPDSVTEIGKYAFDGCTSLKEVYCKATTPPTSGSTIFDSNASGRKIYVPSASVEAYKSAAYWSDYADYIVGYDF